jgi:signal transduction histidine kinase
VSLRREGDFFALEVEDNGPGISPELRDMAFDPYVTTKNAGTGLGLAIVKKIAIEHGGSVTAEQSTLGGARLRLLLPVRGSERARALPLLGEHPSRPGT